MAVQAYVLFKVSSGTERKVCEKITSFEQVVVAGIVYGEYDVVAKISVGTVSFRENEERAKRDGDVYDDHS